MRNILSSPKNVKRLVSFLLLFIMVNFMGCEKISNEIRHYQIKKENKKHKILIMNKIRSGQKLDDDEISNLAGIFSFEENYDDGIRVFEDLRKIDAYKDEKYDIDFNLSLFYLERGMTGDKGIRKEMLRKSRDHLTLAFAETPDKSLALWKRAQLYSYAGCIDKALNDLREASGTAQEQVLFSSGIYLSRDKFLNLLRSDMDRLKELKDHCQLTISEE